MSDMRHIYICKNECGSYQIASNDIYSPDDCSVCGEELIEANIYGRLYVAKSQYRAAQKMAQRYGNEVALITNIIKEREELKSSLDDTRYLATLVTTHNFIRCSECNHNIFDQFDFSKYNIDDVFIGCEKCSFRNRYHNKDIFIEKIVGDSNE